MSIYEIQRITSVEYSFVLSKFSSNIASELYKKFDDDSLSLSINLEEWLEENTGESLWKEYIRDQRKAVYGAFFENILVGTIWAEAEEAYQGTDARIGGLYVGAPGQGLATTLLNHAEMQVAAWRCKSVFIEVVRRSPLRDILDNRKYDSLPTSKGERSPWIDMRKLLVQSIEPQRADR